MNKDIFIDKVIQSEDTLYRVAKSILINDEDCEDAVQNAILNAYDKLNTLKEEQYFKTWLVRILLNECYALKRKEVIQLPYDECFKCIKSEGEKDYDDLYLAIRDLPEKIKITIVLYYV